MQKSPRSWHISKNVWVLILVLAAALVLLLCSRLFFAPDHEVTHEEVNALRSAVASPTPLPEQPDQTADPSILAAPADQTDAEAYLFIILNNRVWGIEPLGEERDVTVDQGDGVVNVIHLLPNGFYMASSSCHNQLCVSEGTVTTENYRRRFLGTSVFCLPHNVQLELVVVNATPDPNLPDI